MFKCFQWHEEIHLLGLQDCRDCKQTHRNNQKPLTGFLSVIWSGRLSKYNTLLKLTGNCAVFARTTFFHLSMKYLYSPSTPLMYT